MAYVNVGSYYAFGTPLGYVLGYVANMGVKVIKTLILKVTHLSTIICFNSPDFGFYLAGTMGRNDSWTCFANTATLDCNL